VQNRFFLVDLKVTIRNHLFQGNLQVLRQVSITSFSSGFAACLIAGQRSVTEIGSPTVICTDRRPTFGR